MTEFSIFIVAILIGITVSTLGWFLCFGEPFNWLMPEIHEFEDEGSIEIPYGQIKSKSLVGHLRHNQPFNKDVSQSFYKLLRSKGVPVYEINGRLHLNIINYKYSFDYTGKDGIKVAWEKINEL